MFFKATSNNDHARCNFSLSNMSSHIKQPRLHMLAGIPCSGKSTYLKKYVESVGLYVKVFGWDDTDYTILSTDKYIMQKAKELELTYSEAFSDYIRGAFENLWKELKEATSKNRSIIWDQTNLTLQDRKHKLSKVPKHYLKTCTYFCTPLEECLKRNKKRAEKHIDEAVILRMHKDYVIPTTAEGFSWCYNAS